MAGPRVAVVGAGAWGTTLARARRPGGAGHAAVPLPGDGGTDRGDRAQRGAPAGRRPAGRPSSRPPIPRRSVGATDLVIFAAPSAHLRATVEACAPYLAPDADLLSVVKGLERGTLLRMSEVIAEAAGVPAGRIAALSGPNLAAEVARNLPASAVVAAAGPRARRARRRRGSAGGGSGSTSTRTSSASSCAGRSRTSSPSRPARPTRSGSATTARPGC